MSIADVLWLLLVLATAGFLLLQGALALLRPELVRRFLAAFASSALAHVVELALRLLVGAGFIGHAASSTLPWAFAGFGWLLVVTTVPMLLLPWRWHRRFARWAVPLATRSMWLYGLACLAAGLAVLAGVGLVPLPV